MSNQSTIDKPEIASFAEAVSYIDTVPKFSVKHPTGATAEFLNRLGNPQKGLRIVHVAGTNGKGSVCAYLDAICSSAGMTTGLFTSPHLVCIRERFRIAGEMIGEDEFLELFLIVLDAIDWSDALRDHPTYFEFLFLIGMLWFGRRKPDLCILETGLGGRLDATNSIEEKTLTIITRIGIDHEAYLGSTIPEIALEKAGILRKGVPAIIDGCVPDAADAILHYAEELGTPVELVGPDLFRRVPGEDKKIDFCLSTKYYEDEYVSLDTIAEYQMENASVAIRAAEYLLPVCEQSLRAIIEGAAKCRWIGRMEQIAPEVFIDGAHNSDGIEAFLTTVRQDGCSKRWLLFGVVSDKDYRRMLKNILSEGLFERVVLTSLQTGRGISAPDLENLPELQRDNTPYGRPRIETADDAATALGRLIAERTDERIYAAGSLYLVGELKESYPNDRF